MKNRRNYYRVLHVQPDAPVEVIRSSYRTIMQKLRAHPDLGGDEWNAALINEAYAVVTDVRKRAAYDACLQQAGFRQPADQPPPEHSHAARPASSGHISCQFCSALQRNSGVYRVDGHCVRCNSPLTPVVPLVLEHSCKRAIARMSACSDVMLYYGWPLTNPQQGTITDLSLNGLGVRVPVRLSPGMVIKLDSRLLCATARVVNCMAGNVRGVPVFQIGAAFLTLEFSEQCGSFVSDQV